jgi:hypothetical protein
MAVAVLGLIFGIGFIFFAERQKRKILGSQSENGCRKSSKRRESVQDFLEFTNIKNGIISLPNNEYRLILEVIGSVNFFLLSEEEQEKIETNFRNLIRSLTFPVQFYTQTRLLDLNTEIGAMQEKLSNIPEAMREYGLQLASDMARWVGSRNVLIKKNYIVIPYKNSDYNEAVRELYRRRDIIEAELSKWIDCRTLSTLEAAKVFYVLFNKNRAVSLRIEDAENYGFTDSYISSPIAETKDIYAVERVGKANGNI